MTESDSVDCVQMKREGARRVQEQINGMTLEQELAFWKQKEARLDRRLKAAHGRLARKARGRHSRTRTQAAKQ